MEKKRLGRPTDDPKTVVKRARLSEEDAAKLKLCAEKMGVSESDIIRLGIQALYERNINRK